VEEGSCCRLEAPKNSEDDSALKEGKEKHSNHLFLHQNVVHLALNAGEDFCQAVLLNSQYYPKYHEDSTAVLVHSGQVREAPVGEAENKVQEPLLENGPSPGRSRRDDLHPVYEDDS